MTDNCSIICPHKQEIDELKNDVKDIKNWKDSTIRSQVSIEKDLAYVIETIKKIEAKLDKWAAKPEKRWDTVITVMITGVITSGITVLVSLLLK